jgi:putative ABC transport system permease protein
MMRDLLHQVIQNIRANTLRSVLTMFGILWGVTSVIVLSAMGEGFRTGNQAVLEELGKNVAIVWGGRTSSQAGGQRAGRQLFLTVEDATALANESPLIAVVSPEIQRGGIRVKSEFNAASLTVHGVEPQYQQIRTLDIVRGRALNVADEQAGRRVAILGDEATRQLFGDRDSLGRVIHLNGLPYTVIGRIRRKDQDSSYSGPDNDKVFVPFSAMARDMPRPDVARGVVSQIILAPHPWVIGELERAFERRTGRLDAVAWPLEREVRRILSRRHDFEAIDRSALAIWDTSLQSLLFGRMVERMKSFFSLVGIVTLALGGLGVLNIMLVAVRERTREIGIRKAVGATTGEIQRQFFLEGFGITMLSGLVGFAVAVGLCTLVNLLPSPTNRFQGMVLTVETGVWAIAALTIVGVLASTYPARRASLMPTVDALRYEA